MTWNTGCLNVNLRFIAPRSVLALLTAQRKRQSEWKLAAGSAFQNTDNLVFTDEIGDSLSHQSIEHEFRRMADRNNLKGHVIHDLRHTFAVELLRAGTDVETVSKWLGHYDPGYPQGIRRHDAGHETRCRRYAASDHRKTKLCLT